MTALLFPYLPNLAVWLWSGSSLEFRHPGPGTSHPGTEHRCPPAHATVPSLPGAVAAPVQCQLSPTTPVPVLPQKVLSLGIWVSSPTSLLFPAQCPVPFSVWRPELCPSSLPSQAMPLRKASRNQAERL